LNKNDLTERKFLTFVFLQRLPIQSAPNWKLRSWKIISPLKICRKYWKINSSNVCVFQDDVFNDNFMPTIGVDFKIRTIDVDSKTIKL